MTTKETGVIPPSGGALSLVTLPSRLSSETAVIPPTGGALLPIPPAPMNRRLRRAEVPGYLLSKHGYVITVATLNKYASMGGGPAYLKVGRTPFYSTDDLDAWIAGRTTKVVHSTSEYPGGRRKKTKPVNITEEG